MFRIFFSETYELSDRLFYDDATQNKVSNYETVNTTLTHNTDQYQAISSSTSSLSNYFGFISPKADFELPRDLEVEIDIKQTRSMSCQWGISFTDSHGKTSSTKYATCGGFNSSTAGKGIICNSPWGSQRTSGLLSLNTWYHFKVTVNDTVLSLKITDSSGNVLFDNNLTVSFIDTLTYLNVHQGEAQSTIEFKNLSVKPL